jgi:hypothetical protein
MHPKLQPLEMKKSRPRPRQHDGPEAWVARSDFFAVLKGGKQLPPGRTPARYLSYTAG